MWFIRFMQSTPGRIARAVLGVWLMLVGALSGTLPGLVLMLISGALIFTGGATSYLEGEWFRRKMTILLIALVFNGTWFRRVTNAREGQFNTWQNRVTAGVALLLWFGVGVAGRAIAFF